jgi:hypothetical protein
MKSATGTLVYEAGDVVRDPMTNWRGFVTRVKKTKSKRAYHLISTIDSQGVLLPAIPWVSVGKLVLEAKLGLVSALLTGPSL